MHKKTLNTRLVSLLTAVTMLTLAFGPAADAAVANWLAPLPGQKIAGRNVEVSVGFNTQSDLKVTRVELWVDGSFNTQKYFVNPESRGVVSLWWDSAKYSSGGHNLAVKIYAGDKLLSTVSGTGTVGKGNYDISAPSVTFANIKSGDILKGKANIKLKASDNGGEPPLVTLLVDKSLKLLKNTPPYAYDLDTTTYNDGNHELETFAYDGAGNKSDPAVVKVAFNNGMKQPVVASLSVKPSSSPAPSEDDGVTKSIPSVASAPVVPAAANNVAARSADSGTAKISTGAPAVPATAVVKPEAKTVASIPAVKVSSPELTNKPSNKTGSVQAVVPVTLANAHSSSTRSVNAASELPKTKDSAPKTQLAAGVAIEPAAKDVAKSSDVKQMAMASTASLRTQNTPESKIIGVGIAPTAVSDPVVSNTKGQVVSNIASEKQAGHKANVTLSKSIAPDVLALDAPSTASPKPVRMAMLPDIETSKSKGPTSDTTVPKPSIKKDIKAKLEKAAALATGQVKLRDFFKELGGVVTWDSVSQTIVVNTNTMIFELKIGSNIVKVNGNDMVVDSAPGVVDGRTVIDTYTYHQICAYLKSNGLIASTKID